MTVERLFRVWVYFGSGGGFIITEISARSAREAKRFGWLKYPAATGVEVES